MAGWSDITSTALFEDGILARGCSVVSDAADHLPTAIHEITDINIAKTTLLYLGFDVNSPKEPWKLMGLDWQLGANPCESAILQRRQLADLILSAHVTQSWPSSDMAELDGLKISLDSAVATCAKQLPEIKKKIRSARKGKVGIPTWQEPGLLLVKHLYKTQGVFALHLSNLQNLPDSHFSVPLAGTSAPKFLAPQITRDIYTKCAKNTEAIVSAIGPYKSGFGMWMPNSMDEVTRVIQAIHKISANSGSTYSIQFFTPFNPLPGCSSPEDFLDLWGHPVLSSKNTRQLVRKIDFILEQINCIFTMDPSPVRSSKHIAIIEVSTSAPPSPYSYVTSIDPRPALAVVEGGDCVLVDVATSDLQKARQELGNLLLAMDLAHCGNFKLFHKGRGSRGEAKRSMIAVPISNELEGHSIMRYVRDHASFTPLLGLQSIFTNRNAVVGNCSADQAGILQSLCSEVAMVSPTKALLIPKSPKESFIGIITNNDSLSRVSISHRRSGPFEGAIFARAALLREHLAAGILGEQLLKMSPEEKDLVVNQLSLHIPTLEAHNYNYLPEMIIREICKEGGIALGRVDDPLATLQGGQWRTHTSEGSWSGGILVQCASEEELHRLYAITHYRRLCIGGKIFNLDATSVVNPALPIKLMQLQ